MNDLREMGAEKLRELRGEGVENVYLFCGGRSHETGVAPEDHPYNDSYRVAKALKNNGYVAAD